MVNFDPPACLYQLFETFVRIGHREPALKIGRNMNGAAKVSYGGSLLLDHLDEVRRNDGLVTHGASHLGSSLEDVIAIPVVQVLQQEVSRKCQSAKHRET